MDFATKDLIERLYARTPLFIQNLMFSAYGWQQSRKRYGAFFREKLLELKRSEWWTEAQINSYQNTQIVNLLQDVFRNVPFYREKWNAWGINPTSIETIDDLAQLPILTKAEVHAEPALFLNERYQRRNLLSTLTSGTTGTPLRIWRTPVANQFQWAIWWRHRARFGLRLGDKFLMFGARLPVPIMQKKPPFWRYNWVTRQTYLSTYHIIPEYVKDIVAWLNQENFEFYTGYPSAMYTLASLMEEQGLRLTNRPKYIVAGSDALLPGFESTIRRVFGVPVTEQYGMAEMCGNFSKCEYGNFHLDFEFGYVELLPILGLENTGLRRMVFTGFANPAMPFIRYDIGDYAEPLGEKCPCGRHSLALKRIDGRVEDFIRTPDGRLVTGMNQVFEWAPGVLETQIIQKHIDRIEVHVVPAQTFHPAKDFQILERELRKRIGNNMLIDFKQVDSIPRSKSGKYRAVISTIEVTSKPEQELRSALQHGVTHQE